VRTQEEVRTKGKKFLLAKGYRDATKTQAPLHTNISSWMPVKTISLAYSLRGWVSEAGQTVVIVAVSFFVSRKFFVDLAQRTY
jgi:hypothetical protein